MALLCALALCLVMATSAWGSSGTIYFTAVNDRLLSLTSDTMPMWSGGALYVPYTVFDAGSTSVSLGVSCSYSSTGNTLTVYNLRKMLVYDMNAGSARDQHSGQTYSARAITRNGRIYVPVAFTCDFFDLGWSNTYTEYGNLIRITSSAAVLSNADFIDAGSVWMASRLKEYLQNQYPGPADTPPEPSASAPEETEPDGENSQVYLAFRCDTGQAAQEILDTLDGTGSRALFFLPADALADNGDLIRRIVGTGHSLGLATDADTAEAALSELESGNRMLARMARTQTRMALAGDGITGDLAQAGWLCWTGWYDGAPDVDMRPATLTANLMAVLGRRTGTIRITMDDSTVSSEALAALLRRTATEGYVFLQAVETRF